MRIFTDRVGPCDLARHTQRRYIVQDVLVQRYTRCEVLLCLIRLWRRGFHLHPVPLLTGPASQAGLKRMQPNNVMLSDVATPTFCSTIMVQRTIHLIESLAGHGHERN